MTGATASQSGNGALWYRFIRAIAKIGFFILGGMRILHAERVPAKGPILVAPLHTSFLDPPAVACATGRGLNFMAKEELFEVKGFGWLIRSVGAFPVRRGENDSDAIKRAIALLNNGMAVLVFPEGSRGDGVTMLPVSPGLSMLAKRTQAQVVPVGIVGTHLAWPKGSKKIRRSRVTIIFGEPFSYADVATDPSEKVNRSRFADELAQRIAAACAEGGLPVKTAQDNLQKSPNPGAATTTETADPWSV